MLVDLNGFCHVSTVAPQSENRHESVSKNEAWPLWDQDQDQDQWSPVCMAAPGQWEREKNKKIAGSGSNLWHFFSVGAAESFRRAETTQ